MLKLFFEFSRRLTRGLIERETEKDYVLRPWTEAENADLEKFCASIGETPSDPEWAAATADGEIDFFNNDPFYNLELPRA